MPDTPPPAQDPPQDPEWQSAQTAIRDAMVAKGYEVGGYENDDALLDAMGKTHGEIEENKGLLDYARTLRPEMDEYQRDRDAFRQWQESQSKAASEPDPVQDPEPARAPEPPTSQWKPPELSELTARLIQEEKFGKTSDGQWGIYDPYKGQYVSDNSAYRRELDEFLRFRQHQLKVAQRQATDPVGFAKESGLYDAIKSEIMSGIEVPDADKLAEQVMGRLQAREEEQKVQGFFEEHKSAIYEMSGDEIRTTRHEGQDIPILTDYGQKYDRVSRELYSYGIQDPNHLHKATLDRIGQPPSGGGDGQKASSEQKKSPFLKRVREKSAASPPPPAEQVSKVSETAARESDYIRETDDDLWNRSREEALEHDMV